jgi:hypothetical protein
MGKLAILGKLWGYVVQFFAKFYGAKMAEADAKYAITQDHEKKHSDFTLEALKVIRRLELENDALREDRAKLVQIVGDQGAHIERLTDALENAKKVIAAMPSGDVWNVRIGANVTPPAGNTDAFN